MLDAPVAVKRRKDARVAVQNPRACDRPDRDSGRLRDADHTRSAAAACGNHTIRGPQWWAMSVLILIMIMIALVVAMAIALERYVTRGILVGALKG
jgi:hypothetical protein